MKFWNLDSLIWGKWSRIFPHQTPSSGVRTFRFRFRFRVNTTNPKQTQGSAWQECMTGSVKLQRGGKRGITLCALFCPGLEKSSPSPASRTGPPDGWPTGPVGGGPLYSKLIDSIFKVSIYQFRTHIIKIIFLQEPPEKENFY